MRTELHMRVRRRRQQLAGALAAAMMGLLGLAISPPASASSAHGVGQSAAETASKTLPAGERQVCPTPTSPGVMACLSVIKGSSHGALLPALVNPFAYRPPDLRQAYKLVAASASKGKGKGMTVAIVDG